MRLSVGLSMLLIFMAGVTSGQELSRVVIGAYGNYYDNNFFNISATSGETMVATFQADEGNYLTQGFQQPASVYDSLASSYNSVDIFPNPVYQGMKLTIAFKVKDISTYTVEIFNIVGARVAIIQLNEVLNNQNVPIDISSLSQGLYLVHVYSHDGKMTRTEKIEKL